MKTVSPERILKRANGLEIQLWVEGDTIRYRGKKGTIPPTMVDVIKANKPVLLAYLKDVQAATSIPTSELEQEQASIDSASEDASVPALVCTQCAQDATDYSTQGLPYCADCYRELPMHLRADHEHTEGKVVNLSQDEVAERFKDTLPGWQTTIEPRTTLRQKHFEQERDKWIVDPERRIPEEAWHTLPRGAIWQKVVDEARRQGDAFTGLNMGQWLKEGAS